MWDEHEEIRKAVFDLNNELYNKLYNMLDDNVPMLFFTLNDIYEKVYLTIPVDDFSNSIEIELYNSENNDRQYDEQTNIEESFYHLLERRIKETLTILNKTITKIIE